MSGKWGERVTRLFGPTWDGPYYEEHRETVTVKGPDSEHGWMFHPVVLRTDKIDEKSSRTYASPPLNPEWNEFTRMQWHVSATAAWSGIPMSVRRVDPEEEGGPARYGVNYGGWHGAGRGGETYDEVLRWLDGFKWGARARRDQDEKDEFFKRHGVTP